MTQFVWILVAWSVLAWFVVWPWSLKLTADMRLRFWIAPQMFRALGLGLLVPLLSPGLPDTFAIPTATVDFFTAILALLAFVGLHRGWRIALPLTWACTIIGLGDLLIAFSIAPFIGVADHLTAQWFIPAFVGPSMIVPPRGVPRGLAPVPRTILRDSTPGHALSSTVPDYASIRSNPVVPGVNQHTCLWRIGAQPAYVTKCREQITKCRDQITKWHEQITTSCELEPCA